MKELSTMQLIIILFQGLLTIVLAFHMFILNGIKASVNRVDKKLDLCQTKENCHNFHEAHKEIHTLEQGQNEKAHAKLEKDIDGVGVIARQKIGGA